MIRALRSGALKRAASATAHRGISAACRPRGSAFTGGVCGVGKLAATGTYASAARFRGGTHLLSRGYAEIVKVPTMAESISEGTLSSINKEVGDYVEQDEEVATIETDKIDVAVNSPYAGIVQEVLASVDETVVVDQPLMKIEPGEPPSGGAKKSGASEENAGEEAKEAHKESKKKEEPKKEEPKESKKEEAKGAKEPKEPKKDVLKEPKKEAAKPERPAKESKSSSSSSSGHAFSREENSVKMNRMRLRIAERLKESQNTAASLTTFQECDMSSVLNMRKLYKDEVLKRTGVKFGFMGLFSKASTLAMKEVPAVNASIVGDNMVYRDYVDISVAVATPKGLVTPVIRNSESLSVVELEEEIANLGKKARDGKLTMEDMAGGTFTISNGGVFGSLMGTPIINMPQCAVLGLHGVKDRPVAIDGKVEIRPMMYLALTYDHRILDGREAVTFLRLVKEQIEDPRRMLLV